MIGGPTAADAEMTKKMADFQVKSSFAQFIIAVGIINLGNINFLKLKILRIISFHFSSICYRSHHG